MSHSITQKNINSEPSAVTSNITQNNIKQDAP